MVISRLGFDVAGRFEEFGISIHGGNNEDEFGFSRFVKICSTSISGARIVLLLETTEWVGEFVISVASMCSMGEQTISRAGEGVCILQNVDNAK